ncbi:zinc-finger domain-containing protein [uncultured Metabacillus sp.]|uniref:zinc-finger domain-containing protein n=1 Tax=Metabacillus sp. Hm71 TaxID=3450743 RepID=UPI00262E26D1|nr:zinc-finger domain-containing protein [uncultured Metabacillus sp.]
MNKKQTLQELSEILDTYCVNCLLKKHFREEYGKRFAHSFCINQCTVGQKIKEVGEKLS